MAPTFAASRQPAGSGYPKHVRGHPHGRYPPAPAAGARGQSGYDPPEPRARYEIWTPAATTAVRGTHFRLGMDAAAGVARVEVLSGALDFRGQRRSRAVSKGFGALAETGRPAAAAARLLAAPKLAGLPSLVERVPVRFSFPELAGAVGYRAQIATDTRFEALLFDGVSQSPQVRGPDLPDGDYVVRVRGIDAHGLEGYDAYHPFRLRARPNRHSWRGPASRALCPKKHRPSSGPNRRRRRPIISNWPQTSSSPPYCSTCRITPVRA